MIKNNNIQCTSPDGRTFFTHFHWLKNFILLLKLKVKKEVVEFRDTWSYKLLGYHDTLVIGNKTPEVISIVSGEDLGEGYFDRLFNALNEDKEITISGWKFKVI